MRDHDGIDRRTFVRWTGAITGTLGIAGCLSDDDADDNGDGDGNETENGGGNGDTEDVETAPEFIEIDDPPEAVYVPTHRESMRMLDPIEAGDYVLAPMLSYPHPFWVIAGGTGEDDVSQESPADGRGVHMMFTLWDAETGIVLPVDEGVEIRIENNGEQVGSPLSPWAMISQEMGFHFGDNVTLPEDGTYTVEVTMPPISTTKTGDLEDRLDERETVSFEFEYDDEFRHAVVGGVEYLDEGVWGRRGALEPMDHGHDGDDGHEDGEHDDHDDEHADGHNDGDHEHDDADADDGHEDGTHDHDDGDHEGHDDEDDHDDDGGHDEDDHDGHHHVPYSALPRVEEYPGTLLVDPEAEDVPEETRGLPRSGDAAMFAAVFDADFRLAEDDEQYVLVSPRTPYNRVPLADMSMRVTVERDGETVADEPLEQTLDSEYDLHYGVSLSDVQPGDSVTVTVESPPQVARHQGYETAFLDMPPVELTVPEAE